MGAYKAFCMDCASAGFMPCNNEVFRRLEQLEDKFDLDWIEYMEFPYPGFDGKEYHADGISINSAYRSRQGPFLVPGDFFYALKAIRQAQRQADRQQGRQTGNKAIRQAQRQADRQQGRHLDR